jgi:hypothetical protein
MEDLKKLTHNLEYKFLRKVLSQLKEGTITNTQASTAAKAFKSIEPFVSVEDSQQKIKQFVAQFPDYSDLAEYADAYYNEKHTHRLITQMKKHLRNNDIDSALKIAQT